MIAVILKADRVIGYLSNPNLVELAQLGTKYDLVETLPPIIDETPEGYYVRRIGQGDYELVAIPEPPKSPEQAEIEQLKTRLSTAEQSAAETSLTLQELLESLFA